MKMLEVVMRISGWYLPPIQFIRKFFNQALYLSRLQVVNAVPAAIYALCFDSLNGHFCNLHIINYQLHEKTKNISLDATYAKVNI